MAVVRRDFTPKNAARMENRHSTEVTTARPLVSPPWPFLLALMSDILKSAQSFDSWPLQSIIFWMLRRTNMLYTSMSTLEHREDNLTALA